MQAYNCKKIYDDDGVKVWQRKDNGDLECVESLWKPGTGKIHWNEIDFDELSDKIKDEVLKEII